MITVVVPIYNKAYSLRRCIDSILSQTFQNFEVIFVDDGSSDESLAILRSICDERCRVITQENRGVSSARNRGIAAANFDNICMLDGDDQWLPIHLETLVELSKKYPDATLYGTGHRRFINGLQYGGVRFNLEGYLENYFVTASQHSIINSSKCMFRKLDWELVGGFPEGIRVGEDLYFWCRLALLGRVSYSPVNTVNVYIDEDPSRNLRSSDVPYPIIYFTSGLGNKKASENLALQSYLCTLGIKHVAASVADKAYSVAYIRALMLAKLRTRCFILSLFILVVPPFVLNTLRRLRNR